MSRLRFTRLKPLGVAAFLVNSALCANVLNGIGAWAAEASKAVAHKSVAPQKTAASHALPLVFEENAGQLPEGTAFAGRTANYTVQVRNSDLRFGLPGKSGSRTITMNFAGSGEAKAVGLADAGFRTNFYLSRNPQDWHTDVRNYNRVALRGLYPGIDAEFYSTGNDIEHDFILAPGANPAKLVMQLSGAKETKLSVDGDVVLSGEEGALKLRKPLAYQVLANGAHKAVDAEFALAQREGRTDLTFRLGGYDHARELVIDPVITYATYVAGNNGSTPSAMASDASGNVYLTGTTTSTSTTFGATSTTLVPTTLADPPSFKVAFVARVSRTTSAGGPVNGSQIAWLTYYGATSPSTTLAGTAGDVTSNAIALQPATVTPVGGTAAAGTLLYIAGQTTASGLPGTSNGGTANLSSGASSYGFVAEFNQADGTSGDPTAYATYVDGGNATTTHPTAQMNQVTNLQALTVDSTGAVTAVGNSTGTQYNTTASTVFSDPTSPFYIDPAGPLGLLLAAANVVPSTTFCTTDGLSGSTPKGLLTTLPSTLAAPTYSTYLCGKSMPQASSFYTVTGVSVTPSTTAGTFSTYIVTGSSNLDFPMQGVYDQPSVNGGAIATPTFFTSASATGNAFAASLNPNDLTVNWSYWSNGSGTDLSNGLTIDNSATPAQVYVFGSTTSPGFSSSSTTSPASTATIGYMGENPNSQQSGFAVALNATNGAFGAITLLEGNGSYQSTITAASPDGVGNIYLAGSTVSAKQSFPTYDNPGRQDRAATNLLPGAQDFSADGSGRPVGSNYTTGYMLRMPDSLASVDYLAYFGPSSYSGSSQAVGVAIDLADSSSLPGTATSPLAYVLLNEVTGGSSSYTTASAESQVPQAGASNAAYLAQVAFAPPSGTPSFSYTPTDGTYTPNPVGFSTQGQSSLTVTWPVQVAAAGTSQLVFNLPQSPYLSAYSLAELSVTIGGGSNVAPADCTLGTVNASANPAIDAAATPPVAGPGITCVLPQITASAAGTTVIFQLANVPITAAAPTGTGSFPVHAAAYDATGASQDLTQLIATAGVPSLSITVSAAPSLVNAATTATQTDAAGNPVTVTYTYTITNSSANDSPNTKLVTNLNTTAAGTTLLTNAVGTSSTGCDPTTAASGCDVPANGSLVYTVKGVYLDSNFSSSGTGPFTVTQGVPSVTFSYPMTNVGAITPTSTVGPSVQVNGTTTITANAITTNQPTYANHTSFQLGDQDVELTASFTNSGKDQAGSYTATVTLPQGYTSTASTCPGATAPYTSCTFASIAPGQTVSFTITGRFEDTGSSTDAVMGPLTSPAPAPATVTASQTSNTVRAQLNTVTTGSTTGTYLQTSTLPAATSIKVTRVNALAYAISAATPLASNTVNELGPLHATFSGPNDTLSYTATVRNTGASVARGLYLFIPVPTATSGTVPVVTLSPVTYSSGLSTANQLTCSFVAAQSGIVCYENDLAPGAALPTTTPHPTTTPQTYTLTFTTSYDETAVPQNVKAAQITQSNGTIYAAADTYNPASGLSDPASVTAPGASINSNVITIERLTSIVSNLGISAVGSAAATSYADKTHITLDSYPTGSAPGVFDTVLFQSSTSNMGPNDAAALVISIPIPALTRVAVPQYCTLNGVTGPSATLLTVSTASTMTCTTPALSTVASSTATSQLRAGAAACPAAPAPAAGAISAVTFDPNTNCLSVAFYAKYSDAPTAAGTVVGSNASAAVGYSAASIAELDVDTPSTPAPATSAAVLTVQRAAHLRLSAPIAAPTYTTGSSLTLDAGGVPEVAQAALHMDPATRQVTSGKVYNCLRYAISVINDGPNYVLNPTVSYGATPTTFVPTRVSTGTPPIDASAVNCAVNALPAATVLSPLANGGTQSAFIDGYFDVGSLGTVNSGSAAFTTGAFDLSGYNDSNSAGTAAQDFASTRTVTLVNTPYTDANNQKFGITAYGTTPQATLIFTSVTAPGITAAFSASSVNCTAPTYDATHPAPPANVNICFPYAKSPLPADNGVVRNLYQPGKTPQYYQVPTTAVVPTATTNPTSVCFTATGSAFLDTFVKPERALLWLMANASAGTAYNSIPLITSTQSPSPLGYQTGDVTSAVIPYLPSATSPSYLKVPAAFTFPQVPQAQPSQICGTVNGLTTTSAAAAASAGSAETFGVLEPVNFPPVVVAGSVASSSSVSKGSTSALSDIFIRRSVVSGGVVTTKYTYDYNDSDPCYIASSSAPRQTCDDNPYLYSITFTGGNSTTAVTTPAFVATLAVESVSSAPPSSYNVATNINLSTSTNIFVSVADQATGADLFNTDISVAPGYSGNPFLHQGNFLEAPYSVANHTTPPVLCDPGTSAVGGYSVTGIACPGGVGGNISGSERYIRGGQKDPAVALNYTATQDLAGGYYTLGNIGAQSVTASNLAGSGLIPLPYPAPDPSTPNQPGPTTTYPQNPGGSASVPLGKDATSGATTAAIASVTAGQTAGFVWPWLSSVTQAQGIPNGALANDKYDLACFVVDSATQQTPQALPTGITCNISTTTPNNSTASPTVYTFADPTVSPANGSSSPTIFITTAGGTLYGKSVEPAWKRGAEGLALAMLFPVLFFRKRIGKGAALAIVLLMLAAAPLLSGCGTGGGSSAATGPTTPTGNYLFRVTATPESTAGGEAKITSAVFEVSVH